MMKYTYLYRDDELKRFEAHKFVPAYLLLALFCMEVLRFCCSSHLNRSRQYRRYHYRNLHAIRDLDEDLGNLRKEQV
jgi:hypothetical protein